jgi:hypothetical protein
MHRYVWDEPATKFAHIVAPNANRDGAQAAKAIRRIVKLQVGTGRSRARNCLDPECLEVTGPRKCSQREIDLRIDLDPSSKQRLDFRLRHADPKTPDRTRHQLGGDGGPGLSRCMRRDDRAQAESEER